MCLVLVHKTRHPDTILNARARYVGVSPKQVLDKIVVSVSYTISQLSGIQNVICTMVISCCYESSRWCPDRIQEFEDEDIATRGSVFK